jgi:hypothetical protein
MNTYLLPKCQKRKPNTVKPVVVLHVKLKFFYGICHIKGIYRKKTLVSHAKLRQTLL